MLNGKKQKLKMAERGQMYIDYKEGKSLRSIIKRLPGYHKKKWSNT